MDFGLLVCVDKGCYHSCYFLLLLFSLIAVSVPLQGKYRGEYRCDPYCIAGFGFPSPCRVNIVANSGVMRDLLTLHLEFPSPCGVNIVANDIPNIARLFKAEIVEFPSPCGVNIVANPVEVATTPPTPDELVSVPLRGKYRGESILPVCYRVLFCSFRPLAG